MKKIVVFLMVLVLFIPTGLVFAKDGYKSHAQQKKTENAIKNSVIIIANPSRNSYAAEGIFNNKIKNKQLKDVTFNKVQFNDQTLLLEGTVNGKDFSLNLTMNKFFKTNDILVGIGNDSLNNYNVIHVSFNSSDSYIKELFTNYEQTLNIYLEDKITKDLVFIELDVNKLKSLRDALDYFNSNIDTLNTCDSKEILWLSKVFNPVSVYSKDEPELNNVGILTVDNKTKYKHYYQSYSFAGSTYTDTICLKLKFEYPIDGINNERDATVVQLSIADAYQHDTYFDIWYWNSNMFVVEDIYIYTGVSERGLLRYVEKCYSRQTSPSLNIGFAFADPWTGLFSLTYSTGGQGQSNGWIPVNDSNAHELYYGSDFYLSEINNHYAGASVEYKQYKSHTPGYADFYAGAKFTVTHNITYNSQSDTMELSQNMLFDTSN